MKSDFLPTATLETLKLRAKLLAALRAFFREQGYWEVETPLLVSESVVDAHLDPFLVDGRYYLQTSPELCMKRLLAAGADAIFQLTRSFRRGERGRLHNPEFTMAEWYRVGDTHFDQMTVVEQLVTHLCAVAGCKPVPIPFERRSYDDVFHEIVGCRVLTADCSQLATFAKQHNLSVPENLSSDDWDGWLNLLLSELIEPKLGCERPMFLHDYPATQAALAKIRPGDPPVAERFELYIDGLELCNGYHELTDADELRRRLRIESAKRRSEGLAELPEPTRLLAAMEQGIPPCAGVALGFDRLMMVLTDANSLDEVTAFLLD